MDADLTHDRKTIKTNKFSLKYETQKPKTKVAGCE